ncbi:MAG: hypothetical protein ACE5MH_09725, partial [Terriglobia bacterium]
MRPGGEWRRSASYRDGSGRIETHRDAKGLQARTGKLHQATTQASRRKLSPAHAPTAFDYGNGVTASFGYNSRLALATLRYSKGATDLLNLAYGYADASGNNNGQILSITDNVDSGRSVNYTYDAWNRLKTAISDGSTQYPQWG